MSKFYRYLKFDNDNSTIRFVGLDATIDNGVTITSGGQTITAGGQTVTAGDVKVVAGGIYAGTTISLGGITAAAPLICVVSSAPTVAHPKGSLACDSTAGVWYVQTGTATTTWKQFATPF